MMLILKFTENIALIHETDGNIKNGINLMALFFKNNV